MRIDSNGIIPLRFEVVLLFVSFERATTYHHSNSFKSSFRSYQNKLYKNNFSGMIFCRYCVFPVLTLKSAKLLFHPAKRCKNVGAGSDKRLCRSQRNQNIQNRNMIHETIHMLSDGFEENHAYHSIKTSRMFSSVSQHSKIQLFTILLAVRNCNLLV